MIAKNKTSESDRDPKELTRMSTSQNVLLRISIVLGMAAAVVTIIYLTPLPDQNFKTCDRPCHELDWPMICRVKLNIEMYHTKNYVCEDCRKNSSSKCKNIFCDITNDETRGIITANRQVPGPSIQVCQNDIMIIDVINKIPGKSITLHWRGQPNHEAPFMDGVPMVTQCPVPSFTTFQYKFRASAAGTHFYHAFADSDRSNGLFGALVVRKADKIEPHKALYDVDSKDHVVLISEWSGDLTSHLHNDDRPNVLLINGRAPSEIGSALSVFHVKNGKRYRFRLAYTGGVTGCPVTVSLDNHLFKVIALDGNPVNPYEVSSFELGKGERLDFVLKANQPNGMYSLRAKSSCNDNELSGLAVVNYGATNKLGDKAKEVNDKNIETNEEQNPVKSKSKIVEGKKIETKVRHFNTSLCDSIIGKVCLGDVKSLDKIEERLKTSEVDRQLFLEIDCRKGDTANVYGGYSDLRTKIFGINNLTFTYPSSPLLTQPVDVQPSLICNELDIPEKCNDRRVCECVHLKRLSLKSTVEIVLIDKGCEEDEHVFHFHGTHFYLIGSRQFDRPMTTKEVEELDKQNKLVKRNFISPVLKDTVRVPRYGVVVLRFIADNPGFWMLRDEKSKGWTRGLDVVFQIGERSDMTPTPSNFPTCGSYIGPEFFLL